MRVLFLCHPFPFPPRRGGKIRPFNVIRHLNEQHDVTVCSLARSQSEADEAQGIAPYCTRYFVHQVRESAQTLRMIARLPTATPSSLGYFFSRSMARRVEALLAAERFNLIFVHCSSVAHYVARHTGTPKILDFGDMDSQKWLEYARYKPFPLRLGYRLEGMKMAAEEKRLAHFSPLEAKRARDAAHLFQPLQLRCRERLPAHRDQGHQFLHERLQLDEEQAGIIRRQMPERDIERFVLP